MFHVIPLQYYSAVFYTLMFVLCLAYGIAYSSSNSCEKLLKQHSLVPVILLALVLILYVGMRPISWFFADMRMYAHTYEHGDIALLIGKSEWLFSALMIACRYIGMSAQEYFLLVAFLYIFLGYMACQKLLPENAMLAFLFFISAFSFWGYATNGIRNGLAGSICLLGIAYGIDKKWVTSLILMYIALSVHRSMMLPIVMFLIATFVVKKPKAAILFWLLSIVMSLIMGQRIIQFFTHLGFDDRMINYGMLAAQYGHQFSRTGFRWDFLLYSAVPVVITWYISEKREIQDSCFNQLANTYILANAFWIMVIQSAFSNRFAYLSWFIYPIVLAYAFIRVPVWENQDRKAGWALILHASFTIFMFMIGKLY